ncbi:MAG: hypothetical protein M2R45_03849 [Verrucomicrobia subdivision 3 bacterium]|nr:hypothetical protein [Limisphaerales bacterium]MCS1415805.1 hypothetical protein [Limisphaerales bacterium]
MASGSFLAIDIRLQGKNCECLDTGDLIRTFLAKEGCPENAVCIFSNGSFEELHSKLEHTLDQRRS